MRAIVLIGLMAVWIASPTAQADRPLQRITVNGAELEYEVNGTGEPVLLIHGTGVAATFAPTMTQPALAGYRLIRFHRRGFAGSARSPVPFSMKDQAADAVGLLKALGVQRAHIVGHSFGGCVTLQLALDSPSVAHSLVVMEPPIFNPDGPSPFAKLEAQYTSGDKLGAMAAFSQASYGTEWRTLASRVPGGPAQVERDVDTVYQSEAPAMTKWRFGPEEGRANHAADHLPHGRWPAWCIARADADVDQRDGAVRDPQYDARDAHGGSEGGRRGDRGVHQTPSTQVKTAVLCLVAVCAPVVLAQSRADGMAPAGADVPAVWHLGRVTGDLERIIAFYHDAARAWVCAEPAISRACSPATRRTTSS